MIQPPQMWEWVYLYAPLAVALLFACVQEIRTDRIKNWLSGTILIYLVVQRLIHQPTEFKQVLLSIVVAFGIVILHGWAMGGIGGGSAKLAVAACAGLPLTGSMFVSVLFLGAAWLGAHLKNWLKFDRLLGSVLLTVIVFAVVGSSLLRDQV